MFNSAHGSITVAAFCDDRRETQDGKFPIKIRVTHKRNRVYYPTGKKLTPDEWEKLPTGKGAIFIKLRDEIQASFKLVEGHVIALYREDRFSFEALDIQLRKCLADSINTAFDAKIEALKNESAISSQWIYQATKKSIEAFAGERVRFTDVTADWLKRFQAHLLSKGKSYTTVSIYTRSIMALMNDAKRAGIIKEGQYPFGKGRYEIPTGEGRKLALTMQQIKAVVTYTDGRETTEKYRDLWFFSYLCNGINFTDLLKLKYGNIVGDEIYFYRQKTIRTSKVKKEIQATITPEMQAIIDRWGNPEKKPDNYIFPYLTGGENKIQEKSIIHDVTKRTNKRLKEIGTAVGIEGLTTYTARHSYATVLKRSGANIAFISESLGHSDLKTTENYLASFEKEERQKNAALLTKFDD